MQVQVQLTEDDYVAFIRAFYSKAAGGRRVRKSNKRSFLLTFCVCASVILLIPSDGGTWLIKTVGIVLFGAISLGLYLFVPRSMSRRARRMLRASPNRAYFAPTTLVMTAAGIAAESEYITSHTKWVAVDIIIQTEAHIFMNLGVWGGFTVPKRCFADNEEARRFYEAACQFRQEAAQTPGPERSTDAP